jgi:hypothetical protein
MIKYFMLSASLLFAEDYRSYLNISTYSESELKNILDISELNKFSDVPNRYRKMIYITLYYTIRTIEPSIEDFDSKSSYKERFRTITNELSKLENINFAEDPKVEDIKVIGSLLYNHYKFNRDLPIWYKNKVKDLVKNDSSNFQDVLSKEQYAIIQK